MALMLGIPPLRPFSTEQAVTLFTDRLLLQYRGDIPCPSCSIKNSLCLDQNGTKKTYIRRRYKHKCWMNGRQHVVTISCGNLLLNCIIPLFERYLHRDRENSRDRSLSPRTQEVAQRYISLSMLACQRLKMEGLRFDYEGFEARMSSLTFHDAQLKAALDAGLLLDDPRMRSEATQTPALQVSATIEEYDSAEEEEGSADPNGQAAHPSARAIPFVVVGEERADDTASRPRDGVVFKPEPLDTVAPTPCSSARDGSSDGTAYETPDPTSSEPMSSGKHTSSDRQDTDSEDDRPLLRRRRRTAPDEADKGPATTCHSVNTPTASILTSSALDEVPLPSLPPVLEAPSLHRTPPNAGLTCRGSRIRPRKNPAASSTTMYTDERFGPAPLSTCRSRGSQVAPLSSTAAPQIHYHILVDPTMTANLGLDVASTFALPHLSSLLNHTSQNLSGIPPSISGQSSRHATLYGATPEPSVARRELAYQTTSVVRLLYLNVQGLTPQKWDVLFQAFRNAQPDPVSIGSGAAVLILAETNGPHHELREMLESRYAGWIKAMSDPSTSDGVPSPAQRCRDTAKAGEAATSTSSRSAHQRSARAGGLLVLARPELLLTIHRVTPYCCTFSLYPAARTTRIDNPPPGPLPSHKALLVHAVYLPPSMGRLEDWSLFKAFLMPCDLGTGTGTDDGGGGGLERPGRRPDVLLGDLNVRFASDSEQNDPNDYGSDEANAVVEPGPGPGPGPGPMGRLRVVEECISKLGLRRLLPSAASPSSASSASSSTSSSSSPSQGRQATVSETISRVDHAFVKTSPSSAAKFEAKVKFAEAIIPTDHPMMRVTIRLGGSTSSSAIESSRRGT